MNTGIAGRALTFVFSCVLSVLVTNAQNAESIAGQDDTSAPSGPSIATDQADYLPGTTAIITGSGFRPGETVTLQVLHADGTPSSGEDHAPWTVLADANGNVQSTWHVCEDDCVGSHLELTATGQDSGLTAQVRFTDAITTLVSVTPASPTSVANCIPFGNNTSFQFTGFIYRDVAAFSATVGDRLRFDLGGLNNVDVRRNIYMAAANKNPTAAGGFQDVRAISWTKVVSDAQVPSSPRGNLVRGDYDLTYIFEAPFSFPGGGLIIGVGNAPPGSYVDIGCEQVLVGTTVSDASGKFYRRFYDKPDQTLGPLDDIVAGNPFASIGGFIVDRCTGDCTPPVITCPANITQNADPNVCSARVTYAPTASDNSGGPVSIVCTPPSGSTFSLSTRTVTCTATDSEGNSASCSFTVTVRENVPPTITCPADIVVGNDPTFCSAVVFYSATASDNCTFASAFCTPPSGSAFPKGTSIVTCTATDGFGNRSQCTFTVSVEDREGPRLACSDIFMSADFGQCAQVVTYSPGMVDNCDGPVGASIFIPKGARWKYLDDGSDQGTTWREPAFQDATWASGPAQLGYGDGDEATRVEDNPTPGYNPADVNRFITTYFRHTFNASDAAQLTGLRLRVLQDDGVVVYLNGTEVYRNNMPFEPISHTTLAFGSPDDGTVFFESDISPSVLVEGENVLAAEIHQAAPNSSDISFDLELIGLRPQEVTCDPPSGSLFAIGTTPVTCTATSPSGDPLSCTFMVTIIDSTPPTLSCPDSVVVGNDPGVCGAVANYSVDAQDDCSGVSFIDCFPPSGSFFGQGATFVSCFAGDGAGNQGFCGFVVIVEDREPPQVLPAPIVHAGLYADFGAEHTLAGKGATIGIDVFDYTDGDDSGGCCGTYRPEAHIEASKGFGGGDQDRSPRNGRDVTVDWVIGWTNPGEWCNYTRTFPEGDYRIFVRWGSGDFGAPMNAELGEITSDPTQPDQTVQRIGTFHNPTDTGGWDGFFISSPLQDDAGQPVTVHLAGRRTLRFTLGSGAFLDWNYLLLVDANGQTLYVEAEDFNYTEIEGASAASCQDMVVSAAPGQCTQRAEWIITDNCGLAEDTLPPGTFAVGLTRVADDGTGNGVLHLTDDGQFFDDGLFFISDPSQGQSLNEITVRWRSLVGGATSGILQFGRLGADGYSFNWSPDALGFFPGRAEEGVSFGLSVTIDTWDNNENFEGEDSPAPGINIKYDGQVLAYDNLADLGDQGAAKDFLRKNQFVDAELVVTADGQVTFTFDSRVLTAQLPGWTGMAFANFSFGGSVGGATDNHWIDDLSITGPGVDYRLDFGVTPPCNPPSGSSFAVGVNPVTCTATDISGNTLNCSFNVIVLGSICGRKFYDANLNGVDDNESGLAGWKIIITHESSATVTTYTDESGRYCVDVLPGVQTVTEVPPDGNWINTTPSSLQVTVTAENCRPVVNFGNVCLGGGGGLTHGYWSNGNGQNSMTTDPDGGGMKANLSFLSSLNLRNPSGKSFDPGTYSSFKGWLLLVDGVNAAYMLSVQLAAMQLNVRLGGPRDAIFDGGGELAGGVNGNSLIYAPGTTSANPQGFATVQAVMAETNKELGLHGVVDSKSPFRAYQEALKDALDYANDNLNFPQAAPCAFTSPY